MRFREFKVLLEELQGQQLYTVGDSHAVGVAQAGGKGWTNLAIGGKSSTDAKMLANISEIPRGATVLVSQGCNDSANSLRANLDSKGKVPLKSPQSIANNVANVVSKVEAQGATVIFLLFPNGDANIKPYYGGDYTESVRQAIKNAVGVPVIDINGKPLADGVHATSAVYKEVAAQVKSKTGGQGVKPASPVGAFTLDVPSSRQGPEVADIQKVLVALGYDLPVHGVDGVRGSETSNAVKRFQQDNNLGVDGDPGPATVGRLNAILKAKPDLASKLVKSTEADVKASMHTNDKLDPVAYNSVTQGKIGQLLDLIAKPESGGHYDIMMGGKRNPAILQLSLNELLQYQREYKAGGAETAAAGRYQFMPDTLRSVAKSLGLDFNKDTFNPKTQDNLAIHLLRQKGLDTWLAGKMSDETFMDRLSQVWAGLPSPSKNGASWYQGVGSNKAGISVAAVQNTLNDIKTA